MNYFLHTGHLHIEGLKMSKSLKNFITIDVRPTCPSLSLLNVWLTARFLGNPGEVYRETIEISVLDTIVERQDRLL